MGLGDLLQISTSMIAAFCAQASSEPEASASLEKLLSILRSHDFLSTHATPAVATALLHAAICFRNDSTRAVACSDAAAAVVDACCSSGAAAWPAFKDGSTVALAWCALHVFVDTKTGHPSASVVCSQLWSKLQQCGVVAAQATALGAVVCPANASPIPITQRLVRLLDALPLEAQLATHADSAIPWSIRHHLSWMFTVDSELLLLQLIPLWISRSSFQPMWILQCAVQSGGDALRCSPQTANRTLLCSRVALCRRWAIARLVLLHIKSNHHPEAVRCACCEMLFLAMGAVAHPAENRNALDFFRVVVEGAACCACDGQVDDVSGGCRSDSDPTFGVELTIIVTLVQHLDATFAR